MKFQKPPDNWRSFVRNFGERKVKFDKFAKLTSTKINTSSFSHLSAPYNAQVAVDSNPS